MANHDNAYHGFRPAAVLSAIGPSNSGGRKSNSSVALTRERTDGELGDEWNVGEASLWNTTLHVKIRVQIAYDKGSMPFR